MSVLLSFPCITLLLIVMSISRASDVDLVFKSSTDVTNLIMIRHERVLKSP
jgi:hypothetical protein